MVYYNYNKALQILDSEGAYFMSDDPRHALWLMSNNLFSVEVNVINFLKEKYANPDKVFVDVGANFGTYTMILDEVFKHTYPFEPDKHTYNILCGNVALHNLSYKTTLCNVGLSDKDESVEYMQVDMLGSCNFCIKQDDGDISHNISERYNQQYHLDDVDPLTIRCKPLTDFVTDNIGLMKIDVEGFELNVLKGAEPAIIASNYPPLVVESWNIDEGDSETTIATKTKLRKDLFGWLTERGYKITHLIMDVYLCEHE